MKITLNTLLHEAELLRRDCNFLTPAERGEPVALWCERDEDYEETSGLRRWITLRADALPNPKSGPDVYFSIYSGANLSGKLSLGEGFPPVKGTLLYSHPASVLPPIDAVFALGSKLIAEWLGGLGWDRKRRPEAFFPEWNIVQQYEEIYLLQHPVFHAAPEAYAVTGGWHMPTVYHDWYELTKAKLLVATVRDSEPWVEAFQMQDASYKVIQRYRY